MQPDDEAIDALLAWFRRRPERPAVSFVPIIGHFECRDRLHGPHARPAGAASSMTPGRPEFYRRNVGLMLIAADRRIFVGRRAKQPDAWQMPQGGIDEGETAVEAACRELWEEVGTTKALLLRESAKWITYDVPEALRPAHWKGRWHGQAQKWFALAFTGRDADIDIAAP